MFSSRKWMVISIAVMLVFVFALTGCGAKEESADNAVTQQNAETNDKSEDGSDSGQSDDGATRIVEDEFGKVEVPVNPQRVAGIYVEDYLLALGVTPVVQWYHPSWGKQDYLGLDVPTFDITGSLEALLEYSPDLIIVEGVVDAAKYEQYSKIAPTYRLKEEILQDAPEILKTIADVLGIPEKAETVLEQYSQKINDAKAKLTKAIGNETVAVVRLNVGDKTLALFGIENRYIGNIYKDMGLTPHPFVRDMTEFHEILSEEKLPELDADHIILFPSNGTWTSEENKEAIKLLDSPMWKSVPAVKSGQVYMADRTHWQSGAITANTMKIDDLLTWFVK
ncbi:ABC transporter substrate-binding protein [Paenibacillus spongiae]|uniref:ABC transporter substrate-binding protein n=1 Tax=Paenibacillus spongiae TaxID=2909671 RepID=A0ABY5S0T0_9BACL|nr:ABC transporter substrate-binding protein [Paenibacillus spongiae]UVI27452.1 ABC transporter substrate-binding protein [Paenibacillus spongiae]